MKDSSPTEQMLECTGGCPDPSASICRRFREQSDGDGGVDFYCAACGHTRECHEPLKSTTPLADAIEKCRGGPPDEPVEFS